MRKVKVSELSSAVLALSIFFYALRGKLGAIFITLAILVSAPMILRKQSKNRSKQSLFAAAFIVVFAVIVHWVRSLEPQYYLLIGYVFTALVLLETDKEHFEGLWRWLKGIAIFEAIGVFTQFLIPSVYYSLMSVVLPSDVISSIRARRLTGYYVGFSREVSFTMFLIVVGLGLYLFDTGYKSNKEKWIPVSVLQFIKSDSKIKVLKYAFRAAIGVAVVVVSYPWWSRIPAFARINEFLHYFALNDIIGMTSGRTVIYENAVALWKTNRWFGIGWGNFKYSVAQSLWFSGFDVHNCFLQILCETGIIGLVLYSVICLSSMITSIKCVAALRNTQDVKSYHLAVFCCYLQVFFVLYSLTEPILYEYTDYVLFFICFNCSNILMKKRNRLIQEQKMTKRRVTERKLYGEFSS